MAGRAVFSTLSLLPLIASGFKIPAVGVPVTHSQQHRLRFHNSAESISTTEWGAECVSRIVPITLEQTSDRAYNSDGDEYDIGLFHALAKKKILVTGTYDITTRLCTPDSKHQVSSRRADTIQFLIHGATYNSKMWDWPIESETYSWTRKMNEEGWATFTWDLIGTIFYLPGYGYVLLVQITNQESAGAGNSTRPDGLVEAQVQSHVETAHQLIQQLRSGSIGSKKWKHIVSAGFSIGSATLNSLADQYPEDADAIILYGFTHNALWVYPGFLAGLQASANQIDPEKWGDIPSTYQSTSTLESRVVACYAGKYDHEQLVYDHEHRDFDSLGAAITLVLHMLDAPQYKGHVMVANGDVFYSYFHKWEAYSFFLTQQEDATFCGLHCGDSPALVYDYIPKAASYNIKVYPKTGHQVLFHHSGPQFMQDVIEFLKDSGF
ncbi:putative valacyclovir hydrolase, partial [Tuber indicum]